MPSLSFLILLLPILLYAEIGEKLGLPPTFTDPSGQSISLSAERTELLTLEQTLRDKFATNVNAEKLEALRAAAESGDASATQSALTEIEKYYLEFYQYDRLYERYFSHAFLLLGKQTVAALEDPNLKMDAETRQKLKDKYRLLEESYTRLQTLLNAPWENFIESKRVHTFEALVKTVDEMEVLLRNHPAGKKTSLLQNISSAMRASLLRFWKERIWKYIEPKVLRFIASGEPKNVERGVKAVGAAAKIILGSKGIKYEVSGSLEKLRTQYQSEPRTLFVILGIGHGTSTEVFGSTAALMNQLLKNGIRSSAAMGAYYFFRKEYADALSQNPAATVISGKPTEWNADGTVKNHENIEPTAPIQRAFDAGHRALIVWVEGTNALQAGGGITQVPPQTSDLVRLLGIKAKRNQKDVSGYNKIVLVPVAVNQSNVGSVGRSQEGIAPPKALDFGIATSQLIVGEPLSAEGVAAITSFKSTAAKGESPGGANLYAWAHAMAAFHQVAPNRLVGRDPLIAIEDQLIRHFEKLCHALAKIGTELTVP